MVDKWDQVVVDFQVEYVNWCYIGLVGFLCFGWCCCCCGCSGGRCGYDFCCQCFVFLFVVGIYVEIGGKQQKYEIGYVWNYIEYVEDCGCEEEYVVVVEDLGSELFVDIFFGIDMVDD